MFVQVINGTGFLPAKVVPGYDIKTLSNMAIKPAPASLFAGVFSYFLTIFN